MKVLIADDSATSRVLLRRVLTRWGYEVVTAEDGAEAWEALSKPDAIRLLDGCLEDSRLVKVSWDNRVVMLFAKDFDERAIHTVRSLTG
jgi:CheY-like chemotaxis protein